LKGGKLKQDLIDQLLRVTFKSSGIQCFCCHGTKDSGLSRFHLSRGEGIAHCFETYLLSCIEVNVQGISSIWPEKCMMVSSTIWYQFWFLFT
jgi:hypothetical protein